MSDPKFGERKCSHIFTDKKKLGKQCDNGAYFKVDTEYLCGVHSKKYPQRKELVKMTALEKKNHELAIYNKMIDLATVAAIHNEDKKGDLVLVKMSGMFPYVPPRDGYINVYPNFKKAWQGIGCSYPELSPMSLGPVDHGQSLFYMTKNGEKILRKVPISLNIENFHQGSKFFEGYDDIEPNYFYKKRDEMFKDPVPHRHKYPERNTGNKNIPSYFVWNDPGNGDEHRLTYIESRQFYCNFYERLAKQQPSYEKLKDAHEKGFNIQICGPDANPINNRSDIEKEYLNPTVPFGHERVLYTMLLVEDENDYPWRKHKTFEF